MAQLYDTDVFKELSDNSDFRDTDIDSDGIYAQSARKFIEENASQGVVDLFSDSCSGRFVTFDIRADMSSADREYIYERWNPKIEKKDMNKAGIVFYQRLSWAALTNILKSDDHGRVQLENLKKRTTWKELPLNI